MLTNTSYSRASIRPCWSAVAVGLLLLVGACGGDNPARDSATGPEERGDRSNRGALPTLAGGIDLTPVDPAAVLVADGLTFGEPLPSEQAAADAFVEGPEVTAAAARRVLSVATTRLVARVMVLTLNGAEFFDAGSLDGFLVGLIESYGGGPIEEVTVGPQRTWRSVGTDTTAQGFVLGNLLVLVTAPIGADTALVVERQVAARVAGIVGTTVPVTPMLPLPIEAPFVVVPTVSFQNIVAPEIEVPPAPPEVAGATGVLGRYAVVAGERRSVAWSLTVDPARYPAAEALDPVMAALAATRAGGRAAAVTEVVDRVVWAADAAPGVKGALAARVFRHGALVVLVEGTDPVQVDAAVADWISTLAG
ncbi:MAG: hypothetical protein EXQ71_09150 [Acidimicrobiia bacterium]|nr:hypothetical protein [Acidimicrobiia bacterium]